MSDLQFNLLPDVKLDYIKVQRSRKLVISTAAVVTLAAIVLFLALLFTADVVQKHLISSADNNVKNATKQLQNQPNLDKILTVQNQLTTLSGLHKQKNITSRLFTFLPELTPYNVKIGRISLDFSTNTLELDGTADSQHTVNTFIDTLKFTTYKVGAQDSNHPAFTSVVESGFSLNPSNASYSLTVTFDPTLFSNDISQPPTLNVPQLTTTRSVLGDPSNSLFNGQTGTPAGQGGH